MSFKVVRSAGGALVAFGPNDDNYEPTVPVGCALEIEEDHPGHPWAPQLEALMAELRSRRDRLLGIMDGIQSDALADGDGDLATAIKDIKSALKDIPAMPAICAATDEAAFRDAARVAYGAIAGPAPAAVKAAFMKYAL